MSHTTGSIAAAVGATCEGPEDRVISSVGSLEGAKPDQLTFYTGGRWLPALRATLAGAVILAEGPGPEGAVVLRHANPRFAFARAAALLHPVDWPAPGVDPRAAVHANAQVEGATIEAFAVIEDGAIIGEGSWIQAHAYVGRGTVVGKNCRLMPGATVLERCVLGDRVWLKPGAVVGADGFGYAVAENRVVKVPQIGVAVLEDDVEVGANACVDRAALGETRIGRGSRLDNMVQVAHGVTVGASCLLAAFSGVAGGAKLGDGVVMGGRAAVVDGVNIGAGSVLAALTSASRDFPPGSKLGGSPARPYRQWLKESAALRRLPALLRATNDIK